MTTPTTKANKPKPTTKANKPKPTTKANKSSVVKMRLESGNLYLPNGRIEVVDRPVEFEINNRDEALIGLLSERENITVL